MSKPQTSVQQRLERIQTRKVVIGSQQDRVLRNYSPNYLAIFDFFLRTARHQVLTFSGGGQEVQVVGAPTAVDARFAFREFDNGRYKVYDENRRYLCTRIVTRHPNVVRAIIMAKKSWGLWIKEWAEGIADGLFTKAEIWEVFTQIGIAIPLNASFASEFAIQEFTQGCDLVMPQAFFTEFENAIQKARALNKTGAAARHNFMHRLWQAHPVYAS